MLCLFLILHLLFPVSNFSFNEINFTFQSFLFWYFVWRKINKYVKYYELPILGETTEQGCTNVLTTLAALAEATAANSSKLLAKFLIDLNFYLTLLTGQK